MPSKLSSETARQRELYKYWQPHTSIFPQAEYDSTFNQNYQPRASYDAALTAYAQLGALRLNVKRVEALMNWVGMISVVDQNFQYVIAESTRSLSLQHGAALDPDDQLWFGLRTIPRALGICAAALGDFTILEAVDEIPQPEDKYNHQFVINDLSKDAKFENQPFVCGTPHLRFYAGVPIRSPAGYLIGIYSIVDDKPRYNFGQPEVDILKDLAATVMDHFVLNTVRGQHTRSARMVKGLGLFVEGKSTLRDWFLRYGHLGNGPTAQDGSRGEWTLSDQADAEFGVEVTKSLPTGLADLKNSSSSISEAESANRLTVSQSVTQSVPDVQSDSVNDVMTTESTPTLSSLNAPQYTPPEPTTLFTTTNCLAQSQPYTADRLAATQDDKNGDKTPLPTTSWNQEHKLVTNTTDLQQSSPLQDTQSLFLRASHLIRESLSVEGCAFLDASVTSFDRKLVKASDGLIVSTSSEIQGSKSSENMCEILGVSVKNRLVHQDTEEQEFSFSADLLQRFLKRYPQGKIFNFEDDGTFSSSEDDDDDIGRNGSRTALNIALRKSLKKSARYKRQAAEEKDMSRLLAILPGVRCVAFFPLWDTETKRWSAAGFAWTKDPIRILDADEDLAYLFAFCNNIMAEKARIDAKLADKMKGNFISSVSHELRSPLHGILASAEHLQDMSLGAAQDELINMINSCSRMLMDTIDSVLDFTKINNVKKPEKNMKRNAPSNSPKNGSAFDFAAESSDVDLSILTEEVVENILSGYNFGKAKSRESIAYNRLPSFGSGVEKDANNTKQTSRVMIIVSIDQRASWVFRSQPGAWRRILMNLFGNALKYTESGQIRVSLQCEDSGSGQADKSSKVTLSVSDTGRGISNDFLKHHLFTPFTQEDSLTPGTGLGLSIVRQLVDDLNGEIELKSEKNFGTEATVQVTFQTASSPEPVPETSNSPITVITSEMQGLSACLVGFDIAPDIEEPATGILTTEAARTLSLNSVLCKFLKQWCGMEISESKMLDTTVADVHILLDAEFSAILSRDSAGEIGSPIEMSRIAKLLGNKAIIVLCTSSKLKGQVMMENGYPIMFVQQPFGPYKLAKALETVLKKKATPTIASSQLQVSTSPQLQTTDILPSTINPITLATSEEQPTGPSPGVKHVPVDKPTMITHTLPLHPKRPTVLLVDDNEINLKLLIMYMRKIGLPFETASNGLEALHKFQKYATDIKIILMDISMPIMDGLTSTREIRKYEQENSLKPSMIIAVTGAASVQARKEAMISGVDQFLTKPVPLKTLKGFIEGWEARIDEQDERVEGVEIVDPS